MSEAPKPPSTLKNLFAGSCAGIASTIACHPLDTIRTRLQTNSQFKGALDCAKQTVAKEGFAGLYKGMAFPLAAQGVYKAVMFAAYGSAQRFVRSLRAADKRDNPLTIPELFVCGAFAGGVNSFVVTPVELIRNRLQVQYNTPGSAGAYSGPLDGIKQVVTQRGFFGMWKGQVPTLCRDMPGVGAWYASFELARSFIVNTTGASGMLVNFTAGSFGGIMFWVVALPLDRIKSMIQTDTTGQYSGIRDCVSQVVKSEGVGSFYRGWPVAMGRGIPGAAITFMVYAETIRLIHSQ